MKLNNIYSEKNNLKKKLNKNNLYTLFTFDHKYM